VPASLACASGEQVGRVDSGYVADAVAGAGRSLRCRSSGACCSFPAPVEKRPLKHLIFFKHHKLSSVASAIAYQRD